MSFWQAWAYAIIATAVAVGLLAEVLGRRADRRAKREAAEQSADRWQSWDPVRDAARRARELGERGLTVTAGAIHCDGVEGVALIWHDANGLEHRESFLPIGTL